MFLVCFPEQAFREKAYPSCYCRDWYIVSSRVRIRVLETFGLGLFCNLITFDLPQKNTTKAHMSCRLGSPNST